MRPFRGGQGSYDLIVPKFQKLAESRHQTNYYVRGTFTHNNLDFSEDVKHLADLGFEQISVEPVVTDPKEPYALRPEDVPQLLEEYDKPGSRAVKASERGQRRQLLPLYDRFKRRPVCGKAPFRLRLGYRVSGGNTLGRFLSLPSVRRQREVPDGQRGRRHCASLTSWTSSNAVMFTPKKSAEAVLQNFTAAVAVLPIPIIVTERSTTSTSLAVSFRKSAWNARL